ncbi:uncharacterized protein IL334_002343 [Kwoniella shivajii]|uniref:Conserved oligomeric Golgi complex subunit 8 n=1 Tax=Kwoniella shivajii TaxID=564305 RepID=A0ABZ1CUU7_9TREE|nr:hypothetical protein IL334_002343 [Kwoniella shivajii]
MEEDPQDGSPVTWEKDDHLVDDVSSAQLDGPPVTLVDLLQSSSSSIDFSAPSANLYVDQLLSLSLHELLRQPQLISAEASTVESDLTNLCFREYPTFISVHKCSSAVKSAFDDFSGSLGKLIGAIPSLEGECGTFSNTTGSIQNIRGKAALVQEHQDKLLDLLELPQLMETCVRNGYYQEAMELLNHCRSLAQKYPTIALVHDVTKEVDGILQLMLAQLLALLREPVKLPALVKTVTFLRRIDAMDESELGLVFISSRYHNFRTHLTSIDKDKAEPVRYLRKYIDLFREHVYDIIAQFTAIFLESSPSEIAAIHITSFANQAITNLVDLVNAFIPRISSDSGSMSSILVQLGYCAMSFSRVGLDFAPLISAPFYSTVLSTFSQSLSTASTDFSLILRDSTKNVLPPSQILVAAEHIPHIVSSSTSPPPLSSIDSVSYYPPIATLVNAYLTAFNNLRLLAPLELHSQIISLHSFSLLSSTSVLLQYVMQATTFSDEIPLSPVRSRPGHARTASAPRADLLRRNSEVLMTPEARANKRREAKRVCVASADVWCRIVVPFLVDKLNDDVFSDLSKSDISNDLKGILGELEHWVQQNGEGLDQPVLVNGNGSPALQPVSENGNGEPKTPPSQSRHLVSSPVTFGSPFRHKPLEPAIPNLSSPTPKTKPKSPPAPRASGIEAVFDDPQLAVSESSTINKSSVPEPANLRESDTDTLQNMETQLEAMNIGLSGEEAAVAIEINHAGPHQHLIQGTATSDGRINDTALAGKPVILVAASLNESAEGTAGKEGTAATVNPAPLEPAIDTSDMSNGTISTEALPVEAATEEVIATDTGSIDDSATLPQDHIDDSTTEIPSSLVQAVEEAIPGDLPRDEVPVDLEPSRPPVVAETVPPEFDIGRDTTSPDVKDLSIPETHIRNEEGVSEETHSDRARAVPEGSKDLIAARTPKENGSVTTEKPIEVITLPAENDKNRLVQSEVPPPSGTVDDIVRDIPDSSIEPTSAPSPTPSSPLSPLPLELPTIDTPIEASTLQGETPISSRPPSPDGEDASTLTTVPSTSGAASKKKKKKKKGKS